MKTNPFKTREALACLPRFTQRFWTWLTALTHQNEAQREPWTTNQHMAAFMATCVVAFALAAFTTQEMTRLAAQALV
jgi:hypothetical protein